MWSTECNKAFEMAKEKLVSADVLVHYDSTQLAGDASTDGGGAMILHIMPDSTKHPIASLQKILSSSECNYSQIE